MQCLANGAGGDLQKTQAEHKHHKDLSPSLHLQFSNPLYRKQDDDSIVEQTHPETGSIHSKSTHALTFKVLVPEARHRLACEYANKCDCTRSDEYEGDHGPAGISETNLWKDLYVDEDNGDLQDATEPWEDGLADEDFGSKSVTCVSLAGQYTRTPWRI